MSDPTTPDEITGDDLGVDGGPRKFSANCRQAARVAVNVCNLSLQSITETRWADGCMNTDID